MNVTIVGGGNVGTQFAVHCSEKGNTVTLFTSRPERFSKELRIVDAQGNLLHSGIVSATDDPADAFSAAELIFITTPSFMADEVAGKILPHVKKGAFIGFVPGTGGYECAFHDALKKGCILFGLQRVPSVARLRKYGDTVCAVGYRAKLHLAAIPSAMTKRCCELVSDMLDMPCEGLANYLNVTLTPSNPILHTSRLYSLFCDYAEGRAYPRVPLFYEEWNDESSERLFRCDDELQKVCAALADFDLTQVRSLKEHYESDTPQKLTQKIRSIESFRGISTPMVAKEGGYIPDFSSRYFTADFPYGLAILRQIAAFCAVATPAMDEIYAWYEQIVGSHKTFSFSDYDIKNLADLTAFYRL